MLRQRFACRRTQLSSLEVVSCDVGLTSKLIYDVVMHTASGLSAAYHVNYVGNAIVSYSFISLFISALKLLVV